MPHQDEISPELAKSLGVGWSNPDHHPPANLQGRAARTQALQAQLDRIDAAREAQVQLEAAEEDTSYEAQLYRLMARLEQLAVSLEGDTGLDGAKVAAQIRETIGD